MKNLFIHNLFSSFCLYFDHQLLSDGAAFTNVSGRLYNTNDSKTSNYNTYGSPYKQFVYDSSIIGSQVPTGVYINNTLYGRGASGLKIDYNNGRAIFDQGPKDLNVSGNYSIKDFNIYQSTQPDEHILFSNRFLINPKFPQTLTGLAENEIVAPAIFLKMVNFDNESYQFGGANMGTYHFRAIILSDSDYKLDAVGHIFTNQTNKNFTVFPQTPLNEFNDIKSGNFNYVEWCNNYFDPQKFPYFKDIAFTKLLTVDSTALNPDIKVGFLEFETNQLQFLV